MGDQTGLSPILSLISIYVGMKVAGVIGMVLGPIRARWSSCNLAGMGIFRGLWLDLEAGRPGHHADPAPRPAGPAPAGVSGPSFKKVTRQSFGY